MNRSTLSSTLLTLFLAAGCAAGAGGSSQAAAPSPPRACEPRATAAETYMLAWNTADREQRRCLLRTAWSARGRYVDPTADVTGIDAFVDHIGEYMKQFPGTRLEPTAPVAAHHDVLTISWRVAAGGRTVLEGRDFGRLDSDGKIALIAGFFALSPPP